MAAVKVLARNWTLEIETDTPSTYAEIKGILSFTFDSVKNDADATTFDSEGWAEHLVSSRGRTISFEAKYLEDQSTGDLDDGQALLVAANLDMAQDSLHNFKLTSPYGTVRSFAASVNLTGLGGEKDDVTNFNGELLISGQVTTT